MSKITLLPLEEEIRNARIDGMIMRAEEKWIKRGIERGIEKGIKRGEENGARKKEEEIIKKLLNNYSPENVSLMLECDIEKIEKISHSRQPHC